MATRLRRTRTRGRRVLASDRALDDADVPEIVSVFSRRRNQREAGGDATEPIDVEMVPERTCIDLTDDLEHAENDEVVDLTSTNSITDSPIVILSTTTASEDRRRRSRRNRPIELDDTIDDDLPVFELPNDSTDTADGPSGSNATADMSADNSILSPPGRTVRCPVCFDSSRNIQNSGRRLMSTNCGHIFCSECVTGAINAQRKCPTCRKKLSMRQVHPIFL